MGIFGVLFVLAFAKVVIYLIDRDEKRSGR